MLNLHRSSGDNRYPERRLWQLEPIPQQVDRRTEVAVGSDAACATDRRLDVCVDLFDEALELAWVSKFRVPARCRRNVFARCTNDGSGLWLNRLIN